MDLTDLALGGQGSLFKLWGGEAKQASWISFGRRQWCSSSSSCHPLLMIVPRECCHLCGMATIPGRELFVCSEVLRSRVLPIPSTSCSRFLLRGSHRVCSGLLHPPLSFHMAQPARTLPKIIPAVQGAVSKPWILLGSPQLQWLPMCKGVSAVSCERFQRM